MYFNIYRPLIISKPLHFLLINSFRDVLANSYLQLVQMRVNTQQGMFNFSSSQKDFTRKENSLKHCVEFKLTWRGGKNTRMWTNKMDVDVISNNNKYHFAPTKDCLYSRDEWIRTGPICSLLIQYLSPNVKINIVRHAVHRDTITSTMTACWRRKEGIRISRCSKLQEMCEKMRIHLKKPPGSIWQILIDTQFSIQGHSKM